MITSTTSATEWSYWTLWSNGQRYTFATNAELRAFSDQQSDERRERFERNVAPWL